MFPLKVYPATVPHLTDSQLKTLGVTAMGDIVSLGEKCHSTVKGWHKHYSV